MELQEKNKYGTLSNIEIENFEKKYGHNIPIQYKNHLLKYNGGKPVPFDFKTFSDSEISEINGPFYGIHNGPYHTRLDLVNIDLKNDLPIGLLAIASDSGGNQICIDTSNENRGKIAYWEQDTKSKINYISNSFNSFLDDLFEWIPPGRTSIEQYIEDENIPMLEKFLEENPADTIIELERTIIEIASIKNKTKVIELLHGHGASLRNAYRLAKQNATFFPDHQKSLNILKRLYDL